jgi:hypothetical protein
MGKIGVIEFSLQRRFLVLCVSGNNTTAIIMINVVKGKNERLPMLTLFAFLVLSLKSIADRLSRLYFHRHSTPY